MMPLDLSFDPPAATISVRIQNPLKGHLETAIEGLIDTGAEYTAIPETLVERLQLRLRGTIPISGIDERSVEFNSYVVNFNFAGVQLERRLVIGWKGKFAVLGRDVLTEFTFTYDGKNRQFELRDP